MRNADSIPRNLAKKSRGLIRSLNRSLVRDDKSPQVVRKTAQPKEPTVCARCGAVFLHKTWRHDHKLTDDLPERQQWGFCPACDEVSRQEGQGRLIIRGSGLAGNRLLIRSRIENVARRAMATQPERRIVSIDKVESKDEEALEVLTTSQKLTHRIAHELKKVFGGRTSYNWSDDGTLFATWELERRKPKAKPAGQTRKGR
jgi:NMD protein affecting ribosome stability and mRNA decay